MRKLRALTLAGLFLLISSPAFGAPQIVSITEAIERVISHHPQMTTAELQAAAARFSAQGTTRYPGLDVTLNPSIVGPMKDVFTVTQELTSAPQAQAKVSIAERQAEQAIHSSERQAQEIRFQAASAYIHLQAAQQVEQAQSQNVALAQRFLKVATAQFKGGNVPRSNVLRAEIELGNARQLFARATAERELQQATLATLMGLAPDEPRPVAADLQPSTERPSQEALEQAASRRPEVQRASLDLAIAEANLSSVQAQAWPSVSMKGFVDDPRDLANNVGIAVTLQVSPWSYQTLPYQTKAAETSVRAAQSEIVSLKQQVEIEARTVFQHWLQARRTSEALGQGVLGRTETLLSMTQEGFRLGANSYLEVLDAQRTLLTTRLNYIQALEEENLAAAEFRLAAGLPVREEPKK